MVAPTSGTSLLSCLAVIQRKAHYLPLFRFKPSSLLFLALVPISFFLILQNFDKFSSNF